MQTLNVGIHTVIILVGPSQVGKSTWATEFSNKIKSKDKNLKVTLLSSDCVRRELLGQDLARHDTKMSEVSEAAFSILMQKFETVTSFPINHEFVIFDTSGFDAQFRTDIIKVAKERHYRTGVVLFDYPTEKYFENLDSSMKSIISKEVDFFKKQVLPGIKRKSFDYSFTVKSKENGFFENTEIDIADYDVWKKSNFFESFGKPLAIVGDVHESVEGLNELIQNIPQNSQLVFLGDLFDKGNKTQAMLELAEKLIQEQKAIMVVGNHEMFIARRLRGEIEAISNEGEMFSSLKTFQQNSDLAQRFLAIFEQMIPYAIFKNYDKTICVTHAPCHNNAIGKHSEKARKEQRNFYFASRHPDTMVEELRFVEKQAKMSHPIHVFGHVAHAMPNIKMKNKIWLDSGAVYGRQLSAFVVFSDGETKIISQKSEKLFEGKLLQWKNNSNSYNDTKIESNSTVENNSSVKKNDNILESLISKYKLDAQDSYWLNSFAQSKAKFISGTMAPAKSNVLELKLEPVQEAISYFQSKNIPSVILQPKWMGSRIQLYLHKDRSKDFAVTRSGTKAGNKDMIKKVMEQVHLQLDASIDYSDQLILDGELLPWSAIGQDLIEKEFVQYGKSVEKELNILNNDKVFSTFNIFPQLEKEKVGIDTFFKQIDIYGQTYEPCFKAFSILALDGVNWTGKNQEEVYHILSKGLDNPYCVIDLKQNDCFDKANNFFSLLTDKNQKNPYEGMVVKPLLHQSNVAPYIKVRNENYLHIIYGHDYLLQYEKMCKNKNIAKKLHLSIKQFELGIKMLACKDDNELLELACQMKFEIKQETSLDSRL